MKPYQIEDKPIVDADVEAAFEWYESEEPGLGYRFLDELRSSYLSNPRWPFEISATPLRRQTSTNQAIPVCSLLLDRGRGDSRASGSSRR